MQAHTLRKITCGKQPELETTGCLENGQFNDSYDFDKEKRLFF